MPSLFKRSPVSGHFYSDVTEFVRKRGKFVPKHPEFVPKRGEFVPKPIKLMPIPKIHKKTGSPHTTAAICYTKY